MQNKPSERCKKREVLLLLFGNIISLIINTQFQSLVSKLAYE